jgi:DNA (cytosine-5)-methyltransferase 1
MKLADIVEDVPLNSELWWSQERCEYLLNQMSDKHRKEAERMMAGSQRTYGTVFRRVRNGRSMGELRTDGIAGCLRTPRGGSGRQILFCAGKGEYRVRLLTPRECARLMGANGYKINVPLNQALFGFGDAVCVPVIRWIAEHYLNPSLAELVDAPLALPAIQKKNVRYPTPHRARKI